jgi:hypothetical protein
MAFVPVATDITPATTVTAAPKGDEESDEPEPAPVEKTEKKKELGTKLPTQQPMPLDTFDPEAGPHEPKHRNILLQLLVGGVVRIGIVMIVLKLSFRWADVHADWGQMFLPALSDTVVRSIFQFLGTAVFHVMSWFYLDECVAFFALLYVLIKSTHACTLSRAVSVAIAAKLMSVVVGGVLVVFLLNMMR